MGLLDDVVNRIKGGKVPKGGSRTAQIILGIVNIFFSGIGTIIAGILDDCKGADIIIGILQLLLVWIIIGWVWSIIWGVLMILDK